MVRGAFRSLVIILGLVVCGDVATSQEATGDVSYGAGPEQRLDLSLPRGEGYATVIFVHGGGLTSGDKADEDYRHVCTPFVAAGIGCANANYRLAPAAWPAQPEDVAAAVAWVRTHIPARGGDPGKLFLLGHSSGAMLVALMGTDERYLARHGLKPSDLAGVLPMGSIMWDDELEQALATYGRERVEEAFARDPDYRIYDGLDAYVELWPIRHLRAGMPPFLFLIAEGEQEHPPVLKTNRKLVEDARALGNRADYEVLPGRTHMSAIRRIHEPGDPVFAIVRDFVSELAGEAGENIQGETPPASN